MPKAYWERSLVKAESGYLGIGRKHSRLLIRERCDKSGFRKISRSPGRRGAKNIIQACPQDNLAYAGRQDDSHSKIFIQHLEIN